MVVSSGGTTMGDLETRIGGPAGGFPSTRQSVLASLGEIKPGGRDRDLERLISLYWKPVYCLIRRMGTRRNEDAKDLTQEFFARVVLEGALAERYTPDKGSFRAYLKTSVRNFLRNEHRDATRLKRGGEESPLGFQIGDVDLLEVVPDAQAVAPEELFDAAWRGVVLGKALQLLEERLAAEGKAAVFDVFRRYELESDGGEPSYESVARALDLSADTVKNHLTRAREEFRKAVRTVVCGTVADPKDLTAELRELFGFQP
jgi:RNA polymerase sigma factor (sigma-70 family)